METRSAKSVHLLIDENFSNAAALSDLKNFLFDGFGNCSVYFHIKINNNPYIIKANEQISVSAADESIKKLKDLSFVKDVWCE